MQRIHVEDRDGIAWITLARPDALNAIDPLMVDELRGALRDARDHTVVLTGSGRAFSAGADLKHFLRILDHPSQVREFLEQVGALLLAIHAHPRATIAGVNGICCAGGLEMMLCCDLAIAAASARIGDAHVNYGLIPGGGNSALIARAVGARRASRLLLTGDLIPADEAERIGLINSVAPDAELDDALAALAMAVDKPSREAVAVVKDLSAHGLAQILERERDAFVELATKPGTRAGLEAFAAR